MQNLKYNKRIAISSDLKGLKRCLELAGEIQNLMQLDSNTSFAVQTVLIESVNNSIMHGNKYNKDLEIIITVKINNEVIFIEVEDQGEGFELDKIPSPIDRGNIGLENGRGIFFIRKFSDSFKTVGKGNIVNIIINR